MKNSPNWLRLLLIVSTVAALALAGCQGDDGDRGLQGPPGPTGPPGPGGVTEITPDPEAAEQVVFYVNDMGTPATGDDVWRSHFELGLGGTEIAGLPDTQDSFAKKYSAQIVSEDDRFTLLVKNLTNDESATYPVFITYGGERNYKQRYIVELPNSASKHISPLQFNDRYQEHPDGLALKWVTYHAERWFNPANDSLTTPGASAAFDGDCAGCHQTGYTLVKNNLGQEVALPGEAVHIIGGVERTFVGSSRCLSCHGDKENWGLTLHKIVHRKPLEFSPHQAKGAEFYSETINRGIMLSLGIIDDADTPLNPGADTTFVTPLQVQPAHLDSADPNGAIDFDLDGDLDEINIGCERCHGPGSAHVVSQDPLDIFNPRTDLDVDQGNMVCGQCHIRGLSRETFTDFFAEATPETPGRSPFPAILDPTTGQLQHYKIGDDINAYYVWDAGSAAGAGSGLDPGRFNGQYWGGEPSGLNFVASRQHHQQYIDMLNGPHAVIRCFDCHDLHDNSSPTGFQILTEREVPSGVGEIRIKTKADDNTLCLSCHAGLAPFADITLEEVADVWLNGPSANLKAVVIQHTQHVYNPQGDSTDSVLGIPGDDLGDLKTSNCVECHMPFVAKTAVNFDIRAHTFNVIRPEQSLSTAPSAGIPNSCNQCHDALTDEELQVLEADYVAKFPLDAAGNIDPAARTNLYVDEWLQSGHADFAGEPFNHWNVDGEIPTTCAKCHSTDGFRDFSLDGSVEEPVPSNPVNDTQQVVSCGACHADGNNPAFWTNDITLWEDEQFTALEPVEFPSGATQTLNGPSNMCMACHQGRSSGVDVQEAIDEADQHGRFINRHYFAAAAILFGSDVTAHFEYPGQTYLGQNTFPGHATINKQVCVGCHLRLGNADHPVHTFEPALEDCTGCHTGITDFEQLGLPFSAANVDYDGDGTGESFQGEIDGLAGDGVNVPAGTLLTAIQNYAANVIGTSIEYRPGSYPYFFIAGTDNSYNLFDDRLLAAAFNFHSAQDPCSDIHNYKYVLQALYDSLDDLDDNLLNNSATGTRPDGVQPPGGNQAPTANAGADQTDVVLGSPVQLDGSASSDPEGTLTFNWTITQAPAGSTAALVDPTTATPTFTPDVAGSYTVLLEVSDGEATASDAVVISTAGAEPPTPPTTVIYENAIGNITFSHTDHVTFVVGDCAACHTTDPPQAIEVDNTGQTAAHGFCGECHAQIAAGQCNFCHGN